MNTLKIKYDPNKSVRENALKCDVSESAVRKYIRVNRIDRRTDAKIARQRAILSFRHDNPNMSITDMARVLGYSPNTVRLYLKGDVVTSNIATNKVSKFDFANPSTVIRSVSESQDEILCNILKLYVKTKTFDCDLTFSKGNFYHVIDVPQLKFDINPQTEGVKHLSEAYDIPSYSLHSIIIDLPFIVNANNKGNFSNCSKIAKRFNFFQSEEELYKTYENMINLAYDKLSKGGFFVVKLMDVCGPNGQIWISNYVQNKAKEYGFIHDDTFILIARTKYLYSNGRQQRHARKYHSYFFVFRKS